MRKKLLLSSTVLFVLLSLVVSVEASAVWSKKYGDSKVDIARSVIATSDGGYAIAGQKSSFEPTGYEFLLAKTDAHGNMEWNKTYGGPKGDYGFSLVEASDGGYAIAGWSTHSDGQGYSSWLVKTDEFGNMEWNQTYGGTESELVRSLVETSDGGYAIAGTHLVKTDGYGNMV